MKEIVIYPAVIEALLFVAENGATTDDLLRCFDNEVVHEDNQLSGLQIILSNITKKYQQKEFGFELVCIAGRYQFLSKKLYHPQIQKMQAQRVQKNLSQSAMETLAIIAYRQPCVKSEIESIRGVNCDYAVDKLLEKNLIVISGQSDAPGKPLIYGTSSLFVDYIGLDSLEGLPTIKELILPDKNLDH